MTGTWQYTVELGSTRTHIALPSSSWEEWRGSLNLALFAKLPQDSEGQPICGMHALNKAAPQIVQDAAARFGEEPQRLKKLLRE